MIDNGVRIRLLGPVVVEDHPDQPMGRRLRRLLTALALSRGMQVSESSLIDIVWGEDDGLPENPARSLQTYVSRLRGILGASAIERAGTGYRLVPERIWLDITEFEDHLERARFARERADDRSAVADLEDGLSLWSGAALSDFAGESWATAETHRLDELRVDAQEQRAELLVGLADIDGALIADLERLALEHPHRDGPTRQLMMALHQSGRQADALAAFTRHRQQLATDLGLDPSADLADLEQQILVDDPAALSGTRVRPLRGYEIIERIGEGAFSIVHRGTQPSVGREVAIKQIRAELANRPEFIRRFETEAHLVARLEHPHIVPLYDYWREPDSAYLVMRLLRGGNLETALNAGPWDLDRAVQMIGHIGGALAEAHRAGVVHRDVKPANILLDDTGNAYLTDFGIALEAHEVAHPSAALSAGSPAYASPEQLRRESATPAADVHGMGIVLYETLTGRLPFPDEPTQAALLQRQLHDPIPSLRDSRTDVPPALDAVIATATAKRAEERFQSIDEFVDAVHDAVDGAVPELVRQGIVTALRAEERNPYKGLRAFDEADADDFAGRSRLVDQLVAKLGTGRFLAVVGPSGSGKSSAVRAGLLPTLRRGALPGSDRWFVTTMLPGPAPFEELETALLRVAAERPADLLGVLTDGVRGIARGLRHAVPAEDAQVLLVIDQFEELFTLADPAVAIQFLDALATAVTEERPRVRVVLTLRADFYDRPLRHGGIGRLVRDSTIAVLPLAADELEHAIVDPAAAVGVLFEPGLVSQIVADVADQPGALPMLQYALTELYERQVSGLLTQSAYRDFGGVAGALGRRAEEIYAESTPDQQIAIRRAFGRLVSLGEGTEDTRRRALRLELGNEDSMVTVVDRFGKARLLSFDRDPVSREATVEVAHEALLREWPRLQGWLDEDRDGLRILRHLSTTATGWNNGHRPPGELYRGGRLEATEEWASSHASDLTPVESDFIEAGVEAREVEVEAARRTTRRLRQRLTGTAMVAVLALVAGTIAIQQQRSASHSADRAEAAQAGAETAQSEAESARLVVDRDRLRAEEQAFDSETGRLVATAANLAETNARAALLLAVAAHGRDPTAAALGALQQTLIKSGPILQHLRWGTSYLDVEWISNERVIGTRIDGVDLIDLGSGEVVDSISVTNPAFAGPEYRRTATDAAGSLLAVLSDLPNESDGPDPSSISVYDIGDQLELRFTAPLDAAGLNVAVSPSGDLVVTTGATETESVVQAWSSTGEPLWEPRLTMPRPPTMGDQARPVLGAAVADSDAWALPVGAVTTVTDEQIFVANGAWLRRLSHSGAQLGEDTFLIQASGGPAVLWDVVETETGWYALDTTRSGAIATVERDVGWPEVLTFESLGSPLILGGQTSMTAAVLTGDTLVTTRADGLLVSYDPATREVGETTDLEGGRPETLALSPNGDRLVVAHSSGLSVVSLDESGPLSVAIPRHPQHRFLTISDDGSTLMQSPLADPTAPPAELWRVEGGEAPRLDPDDAIWESSAFVLLSSNPDRIITSTLPFGFHQVDYALETREVVTEMDAPVSSRDTATVETPLGLLRAIAVRSGPAIEVYRDGNWDNPEWVMDPPGAGTDEQGEVWGLSFDPIRPRLLIADSEGNAELWDLDSRTTLETEQLAMRNISLGGWSADGTLVATAAPDGTFSIRDGETFAVRQTMASSGQVSDLGGMIFSPDNSLLLTSINNLTQLWDVETGERIGIEFPVIGADIGLVWSNVDDEQLRLVTASENHSLIWNLDAGSWADVACQAAGSNLTVDEWEQWGPRDTERYAICPGYPLPG